MASAADDEVTGRRPASPAPSELSEVSEGYYLPDVKAPGAICGLRLLIDIKLDSNGRVMLHDRETDDWEAASHQHPASHIPGNSWGKWMYHLKDSNMDDFFNKDRTASHVFTMPQSGALWANGIVEIMMARRTERDDADNEVGKPLSRRRTNHKKITDATGEPYPVQDIQLLWTERYFHRELQERPLVDLRLPDGHTAEFAVTDMGGVNDNVKDGMEFLNACVNFLRYGSAEPNLGGVAIEGDEVQLELEVHMEEDEDA